MDPQERWWGLQPWCWKFSWSQFLLECPGPGCICCRENLLGGLFQFLRHTVVGRRGRETLGKLKLLSHTPGTCWVHTVKSGKWNMEIYKEHKKHHKNGRNVISYIAEDNRLFIAQVWWSWRSTLRLESWAEGWWNGWLPFATGSKAGNLQPGMWCCTPCSRLLRGAQPPLEMNLLC